MPSSSSCMLDSIISTLGDPCTLGIIHELSAGPRRSLDLMGAFKGLSTKTVTARLRSLARKGIVARRSFPESPPRVEYSLTEKGRELLPVLSAITEVALKWRGDFEDEGGKACQACAVETTASHEPARPQTRARKQTDVTLL